MFHLVFIVSRGKWRKSFIGGASFSRPSPLFSLRYHFSTPTRWVSVSNCVPCNRIATRSIKLQEDWLSGYGFAAFAYVQMMILCYSGNKIRETVSIFFSLLLSTYWIFFLVYSVEFPAWGAIASPLAHQMVCFAFGRAENVHSLVATGAEWTGTDHRPLLGIGFRNSIRCEH